MFPPKDIARNLLMSSPRVRRASRRHHATGILGDSDEARRVIEELIADVRRPLHGCHVLELGPARGVALMQQAQTRGAECSAFDVVDYLTHAEATELGIDYRVAADGSIPWPDCSFDVVWSHSVLEHVRDPSATLGEIRRVLRPGGHHVALVDLESHYGGRGDPREMYGFLRYSPRFWDLMASNRSSWLNRLRLSDWRRLLVEADLEPVAERPVEARCGLVALRQVAYLDRYSDEDVLTKRAVLTSRRSD